jgi:hypothetical protein
MAHYRSNSAEVVTAVENAKKDPDYSRKLHRAVLIAWARNAPVATPGLRWAFREHYGVERRTARRIEQGRQVKVGDGAPGLNPAMDRALARALLGRAPTPEDLAAMEHYGPILHEAAWRSGLPSFLPLPPDGQSIGLATRRADGTWRPTPLGLALWEALALTPVELVTRIAPREELDIARLGVRSGFRAAGFNCSDLVAATSAPIDCGFYRKRFGTRWWESSEFRRPPGPRA